MASKIACVKCLSQMSPMDLGLAAPTARRDASSKVGTIQAIAAPFGRNGWSIAAGYLGLFAVLPFFGIFAILTGYLGLESITPKKPCGRLRSWFGILSGTIFTILYLFGVIVIALKSPNNLFPLITYTIVLVVGLLPVIVGIKVVRRLSKGSGVFD